MVKPADSSETAEDRDQKTTDRGQRVERSGSAPTRGGGLVDFIVTSDVDEEHLVFLNKLKNNPTVFVNANPPSAVGLRL